MLWDTVILAFYITWPMWAIMAFFTVAAFVLEKYEQKSMLNSIPKAPAAINDRVMLVRMPNDPCPIEPGTWGTVTCLSKWTDGSWTLGVKWDNGRTLGLVYPEDRFVVAR